MTLVSHNDILARPAARSTRCSLHYTSDIAMREVLSGKNCAPLAERYLMLVRLLSAAFAFFFWSEDTMCQHRHHTLLRENRWKTKAACPDIPVVRDRWDAFPQTQINSSSGYRWHIFISSVNKPGVDFRLLLILLHQSSLSQTTNIHTSIRNIKLFWWLKSFVYSLSCELIWSKIGY